MMANFPQLTFFCELPADQLTDLFSNNRVIDHLQDLGAAVNMGILDLSAERAAVVQKLNRFEIPVIGWLLLPIEDGYWFNINNVSEATARYEAFKAWSAEYELVWDGIGLDIEPDRREAEKFIDNRMMIVPMLLKNLANGSRLEQATAAYSQLVKTIRADGYRVDSYHMPPIVDERTVGSTLLQRLFGLVDVEVDREVLMLYSSFLGAMGTGLLWSYGREAESIGVGSTGGGVEIGDLPLKALSWEELARDLRLAARLTEDIHVFSLEGCVERGYLAKLVDFDWSVAVEPPIGLATRVDWIRLAVRGVMWTSKNPLQVLVPLIIAWIVTRRKK